MWQEQGSRNWNRAGDQKILLNKCMNQLAKDLRNTSTKLFSNFATSQTLQGPLLEGMELCLSDKSTIEEHISP